MAYTTDPYAEMIGSALGTAGSGLSGAAQLPNQAYMNDQMVTMEQLKQRALIGKVYSQQAATRRNKLLLLTKI